MAGVSSATRSFTRQVTHQAAVKSTNTGLPAALPPPMRAGENRSQPSNLTPDVGPPEAEAAVAGHVVD